jgi:superfamily II DNA or RNA helicase
MFWKPLTAADFNQRFLETQQLLQNRFEQELKLFDGGTLRQEYQPNAITKLLQGVYGDGGSKTVHIGCGGGKSAIFILAALQSILDGRAKKICVTAPTIVLNRQQENSFVDMLEMILAAKGVARLKSKLRIVNVSSDGQKKCKDLAAEDLAEERGDDDQDLIDETRTKAESSATRLGIEQHTTMNHDALESYLSDEVVTIFFVCKPSFIKNFTRRVEASHATIDITIFDEYHNFISQNSNDGNRSLLKRYEAHCINRWFFSASKKAGALFSWFDPVFGEEICDVKSSDLVKWGYLVPNLKVYFITAGQIKGITDAVRAYFDGKKIKNPEKFFREMAVILAVMRQQLMLALPQGIMFGSSVTFINEMMKCEPFRAALEQLVENLQLYRIVGSTDKEEREEIFKKIKSTTDCLAFLLLNHSVIKEGVDVTRFNMALITRGMSEHALQQALGRIQRKYDGKETAYLYLYVDADNTNELKQKLSDIALKLHYNIGDLPVVFADLFDEQVGKKTIDEQEYLNIDGVNIPLLKTDVNCTEVVANTRKAEIERVEHLEQLKQLSKKPLIDRLQLLGAI